MEPILRFFWDAVNQPGPKSSKDLNAFTQYVFPEFPHIELNSENISPLLFLATQHDRF